MGEYSLYIHTNKMNGKRYVGITKQNPEQRWGSGGSNYKESTHFNSAISKYGWDNFDHKIVHNGMTKEDACLLEKYYIDFYKSQDNRYGYNIYEGGTAPTLPQETREKNSL